MSNESVERDIGRLIEGVDALRRDFERSDAKADAHRKMVYDRLAQTERDLTAIAQGQKDAAARITAMEPEIESLRRLKQRGIGVLAAVGILSTLLGVTIADGWAKVLDGIRTLFSGG